MFSMPSQNTRREVRLNEKVESRVRGDLYARSEASAWKPTTVKSGKALGA